MEHTGNAIPSWQRDTVFVKALRNNGYCVTSGNINYVGLCSFNDIGDTGIVVLAYIGAPYVGERNLGRDYEVELHERKFERFTPSLDAINTYIHRAITSQNSQGTNYYWETMSALYAYKLNVLNVPWEEFSDYERAFAAIHNDYLDHLKILQNITFPSKERIKSDATEANEVAAVTMNLRSAVPAGALEEVMAEMIAQVDKKRMMVLFSLAAAGRDRSVFIKDRSKMEAFLQDWARAKAPLYLAFGRKLSISKYAELSMNNAEFAQLLEELYGKQPQLIGFLEIMRNHIGIEGIMENSLRSGWADEIGRFSKLPDHIKSQTKLTQVVSRMFDNPGADAAFSELYTNKTVKALMEISIDPYDYLTMSINNNGWQSCHRINGGEFSTGPFAYLIDENTAVAFSHRGEESQYSVNNFKWRGNSKRWRQLVHIDLDTSAALFSREYPTGSDETIKFIREMYEENMAKYFNVENIWMVTRDVRRVLPMATNGEYAYDDINRSDKRKYAICHRDIKAPAKDGDRPLILMGSLLPCIMCREKPAETISGTPICNQCRKQRRKENEEAMRRELEESHRAAMAEIERGQAIDTAYDEAVRRLHDLSGRPILSPEEDRYVRQLREFIREHDMARTHDDDDDDGDDVDNDGDDGDDVGNGGGYIPHRHTFDDTVRIERTFQYLEELSRPARENSDIATVYVPDRFDQQHFQLSTSSESTTSGSIATNTSGQWVAPWDTPAPGTTYQF